MKWPTPERLKPLPSTIMARPTVFDVLRDRINADVTIPSERKVPVFLKSSQIIRERGLTQI